MTVKELLSWCQAQADQEGEVMVHRGPVVGFGYLDVNEIQVDDDNAVDGIHPWLK
jgi:hypothetical protein